MLKMKTACEKCSTKTGANETAYIYSFECTFCEYYTTEIGATCTKCAGELLLRPKILKKPLELSTSTSQLKANLFGQ